LWLVCPVEKMDYLHPHGATLSIVCTAMRAILIFPFEGRICFS